MIDRGVKMKGPIEQGYGQFQLSHPGPRSAISVLRQVFGVWSDHTRRESQREGNAVEGKS